MDTSVQSREVLKLKISTGRRSIRFICAFLGLPFAVALAGTWWLTPVAPYATLPVETDSVDFSPDGTMFVTSGKWGSDGHGGPLRVWIVATGQERCCVAADWKAIETVLFSPDGSLLAAHEREGELKLWDTQTGDEVATIQSVSHFGNWVNFCFSPDGRWLVFQDYGKGWPDKDYITFWNIETHEEHGSVESYFWTLAFASDGQSFATYRRTKRDAINEVILWKIDNRPVLVKRHPVRVSEVAFSPDLSTFAVADDLLNDDGQVDMRDMMTGDTKWSVNFDKHGTYLQDLSFLSDGKVLAAHGGGGTQLNWHWRTTLWDVTSAPKTIGSFSETPSVSPDGAWLAVPLDAGAKLGPTSTPGQGETDLVVDGDTGPSAFGSFNNMKTFPTLRFSPDSMTLVVKGLHEARGDSFLERWLPQRLYRACFGHSEGSVVHLWDTGSRRNVFSFRECRDVRFAPNGNTLATVHDGQVLLWRLPLRKPYWQVLCQAALFWLMIVPVEWLGYKTLMRWVSPVDRSDLQAVRIGDGQRTGA